jgi:hypothetical protein
MYTLLLVDKGDSLKVVDYFVKRKYNVVDAEESD